MGLNKVFIEGVYIVIIYIWAQIDIYLSIIYTYTHINGSISIGFI